MLAVEQDDFVFEPHWCVCEIDELEPRLIWAVPQSAVPTIQRLLGEAVQSSQPLGSQAERDPLPVEARARVRRALRRRDCSLGGAAGDRGLGERHLREESERFKRFTYDELLQRDKVSLDLTWLRDESLEDLDNLPPPDVIAREIVEDLEAALAEYSAVAGSLGEAS
jgi:hypothetical protein